MPTDRTDDLVLPPGTDRFVVLGDPHGDQAGLDAALALEERPGTVFASAGDNIGYADGLDSSAVCRRLAEKKIRSVFGNHEHWLRPRGQMFLVSHPDDLQYLDGESFDFCRALPLRLRVTLGAVPDLKVTVIHTLVDLQRDSWDYVSSANADLLADAEGADVVFSGHSHGPAIYSISPSSGVKTKKLALEEGETVTVKIKKGYRYVVDCGSLARPGFHPSPGRRDLASWGFIDLGRRVLGVRCAAKKSADR